MSSGRHSLLGELEKMSGFYVNFYFKNIEHDDGFYGGKFSSPDSGRLFWVCPRSFPGGDMVMAHSRGVSWA